MIEFQERSANVFLTLLAGQGERQMRGLRSNQAAKIFLADPSKVAATTYEIKHCFPNGSRSVYFVLDDDYRAMSLAEILCNGVSVEVWSGERLVGRMTEAKSARISQRDFSGSSPVRLPQVTTTVLAA